MAQNPLIKRYLDAGMAFTQMTQARAEAIVADLVKTGEVQAQKTEQLVTQLVERSRANTERLLDVVRSEVRSQVAALGLATQDDIARLEARIDAPPATATSGTTGATKKRPAKKTGAKKTGAKKTGAKKTGAKKRAAKRSAASRRSS